MVVTNTNQENQEKEALTPNTNVRTFGGDRWGELDLVRSALQTRLAEGGRYHAVVENPRATLTTWERYVRWIHLHNGDVGRFLERIDYHLADVGKDSNARSVGAIVTRRLQQEFGLPRGSAKGKQAAAVTA